MAYKTDLTTLLSSYGFNNNIRVGCPALWMVNYGNTNDPLDALALGTLNPADVDLRGYDFTTLTMRAQSFPRGLMFPKALSVSTAGGITAYGVNGDLGWKDPLDKYVNKSSCMNKNDGTEYAYINYLYFQQDATYTYFYMSLKCQPTSYAYGTSYSTATTSQTPLEALHVKVPRSIYANTIRTPLFCYKGYASGGRTEQVTWDTANNLMNFSKKVHRVDASTDSIHLMYNDFVGCVNNNLPVGIRIGHRYA